MRIPWATRPQSHPLFGPMLTTQLNKPRYILNRVATTDGGAWRASHLGVIASQAASSSVRSSIWSVRRTAATSSFGSVTV